MLASGKEGVDKRSLKCKMMVMTSKINHDETVKFFKDNNYFQASKDNFIFFQQSVLPAVDKEGKIIMKTPSEV